jgi:hypothetical protein
MQSGPGGGRGAAGLGALWPGGYCHGRRTVAGWRAAQPRPCPCRAGGRRAGRAAARRTVARGRCTTLTLSMQSRWKRKHGPDRARRGWAHRGQVAAAVAALHALLDQRLSQLRAERQAARRRVHVLLHARRNHVRLRARGGPGSGPCRKALSASRAPATSAPACARGQAGGWSLHVRRHHRAALLRGSEHRRAGAPGMRSNGRVCFSRGTHGSPR